MSKESEEMLKQNRVSSSCGVKKSSIDISVCKKYCNCACKNGKREEKKDSGNNHCSDK